MSGQGLDGIQGSTLPAEPARDDPVEKQTRRLVPLESPCQDAGQFFLTPL